MKLAWNDLTITEVPEADLRDFISWFAPIMPKASACRSVFFNRLGEWFVQTPDLALHKVSILSGESIQVAASNEEFTTLVNTQAWQEDNLWSQEVFAWKSEGIAVKAGQVYAFVPHPMLNDGRIPKEVMPMELKAWLLVCANLLGLVKS